MVIITLGHFLIKIVWTREDEDVREAKPSYRNIPTHIKVNTSPSGIDFSMVFGDGLVGRRTDIDFIPFD